MKGRKGREGKGNGKEKEGNDEGSEEDEEERRRRSTFRGKDEILQRNGFNSVALNVR